ncbi:uncharacterized protein LOC121382159 isoform X2 [Gigantopelta aegis]|uniref:uncharacterized protein LOC121382159 isoform X2 n=1 Tax=Gigantopelta aegis TaxID=1735272 RepID=UPI001B88B0B0|nr:uncharacterized protein LOC121382159 isoform X2 [Gigantopelta aegis]
MFTRYGLFLLLVFFSPSSPCVLYFFPLRADDLQQKSSSLTEMNLKKTKVYKLIESGERNAVIKGMCDYLKSGKNPNTRDAATGESLLHHIVRHADRFSQPDMVLVIYMLACKDVDVDAIDNMGETGLHKVVRQKGGYRILIALMRCGVDTSIRNNAGLTAEEVLLTERPEGWQETLHWYNKFKPGLWVALRDEVPDRRLIERLLQSWCRLTTVKDGKVFNLKTMVQHDARKLDLLHMMDKYENTIELALAFLGGLGFIVRKWQNEGILNNCDINACDISYQRHYPEFPPVPQPMLAATWEVNSLNAVDAAMDMHPDTAISYNDTSHTDDTKPLFFHILTSPNRPDDDVIERVIKGSNMAARNPEGQTILHHAINCQESNHLVETVLACDVDVAARDRLGRTARDLAEKAEMWDYVKLIDQHVFKLLKNKKFDVVENLILHMYDHITDIKDSFGKTAVDYAKKNSTRQIAEVVQLSSAIQGYVNRVFLAVQQGSVTDLQKLLSCKKYALAKDKTGQTPLLRAIMEGKRDVLLFLISEFPATVTDTDSLQRSSLHYARLFMNDPEVIDLLKKAGANADARDTFGRIPVSYSQKVLGNQAFAVLKKEIKEMAFDVYLQENNFDERFRASIQGGNYAEVVQLVTSALEHGDVTSRFRCSLFKCVDLRYEKIAIYLIKAGFTCDIHKQYSRCDPRDAMCAMMECGHRSTSLRDRAIEQGCADVVRAIDEAKFSKGEGVCRYANGDFGNC